MIAKIDGNKKKLLKERRNGKWKWVVIKRKKEWKMKVSGNKKKEGMENESEW